MKKLIIQCVALNLLSGLFLLSSDSGSDEELKDVFGMSVTIVTSAKTKEELIAYFANMPLMEDIKVNYAIGSIKFLLCTYNPTKNSLSILKLTTFPLILLFK